MTFRLPPFGTDIRIIRSLAIKQAEITFITGGLIFFQTKNGKTGEDSQKRPQGTYPPAPESTENTI